MAQHRGKYKLSAVDATSATLVPVDGVTSVPDYADKVSQIVVTFTNARDAKEFDITNRIFMVSLERM